MTASLATTSNNQPLLHSSAQQPILKSNQTSNSSALPCTPPTTTNITTIPLNTLNGLKSKFEQNPALTKNSTVNNQRLVQSNFAAMSINNDHQQQQQPTITYLNQTPTNGSSNVNTTTTPSSAALSSASTLTLCNSNSSVVTRSSYFNRGDHHQYKQQHNTPNSIFSLSAE
jgi:hypothetical protein